MLMLVMAEQLPAAVLSAGRRVEPRCSYLLIGFCFTAVQTAIFANRRPSWSMWRLHPPGIAAIAYWHLAALDYNQRFDQAPQFADDTSLSGDGSWMLR